METIFFKNCPKCGKIQNFATQKGLNYSVKNNKLCKSCVMIGLSESHKGKQCGINSGMYGKRFNHIEETKRKISINSKKTMLGRKLSEETKKKIGESSIGRIVSDTTKEKQRAAVVNRIKKYGIRVRNFNPRACEFIDKINKERGWNLQHALNGGEYSFLGYFVDVYDKEKNIVFEYDEKVHSQLKRKEKDIIRQNRIFNALNPTLFLRYNDLDGRLYDVNNTQIL